MKLNLLKLLSLTLLVATSLTFQSCDPDPCKDVLCDADHGVCIDGTCDCDPGYSGTDCAILLSSSYTGTFDAVEVCGGTDEGYVAEVRTSADGPQYIIITNIFNHFQYDFPGIWDAEDTRVKAIVSDAGIVVEEQALPGQNLEDYRVSGSGPVVDGGTGQIQLNFRIWDSNPADPNNYLDQMCSVTYTPQ